MNESALTKKLATYARREPKTWIRKVWGGPQGAGWPDLVGVSRGVFLGLEVKLPGKEKTLTKLQAETLSSIRSSGGVGLVITKISDMEYALTLAHLASLIGDYTIDPSTGCYLRNGSTRRSAIGATRHDSRVRRNASRVVAAIYHGLDIRAISSKSPTALEACHSCDVPGCINPDHIFLGTQAENARDMVSKGRSTKGTSRPSVRGALNPQAKLSRNKVLKIRKLYATGKFTQARLAELAGVNQVSIGNIVAGRTWAEGEEG